MKAEDKFRLGALIGIAFFVALAIIDASATDRGGDPAEALPVLQIIDGGIALDLSSP